MKKSLYKKLVKMARDGDAEAMEAVQEIAEEILEEAAQDPTAVAAVPVAVPAVPVVAAPVAAGTGAAPMAGTVAPVMAAPVAQATQAAQVVPVAPVATVPVAIVPEAATPENAVVRPEGGIAAGASEDEAGALGAILVKLDQLIDLLTPMAAKTGGAGEDEEPGENGGNGNSTGGNGNGGNSTGQNGNGGNEAVVNKNGGNGEAVVDPVEEIVQAIAEATEEVATGETAPAVAEAEAVAQIAEVVEAVVGKADDPDDGNAISGVLEPEGEDECSDPDDNRDAGDALRAALTVIRPALAKMSKQQRMKVSADIAARMRKKKGKRTGEPMTPGAYVALAQARDRRQDVGDPRELGRKIMEKRNLNYQK